MNKPEHGRDCSAATQREGRGSAAKYSADARRVTVALLWTTLAGALLARYGTLGAVLALLPASLRNLLVMRLVWAALHVVMYAVVPMGLAYACGVRARELGLRWPAPRRYIRLLLGVVAMALPVLLVIAQTAEFRSSYPMFRPGRGAGELPLWLCALGVYLFSIELYFRGFLLTMLTPSLGRHAVLVALVPYVATHRYLPEALGAIPVGLLLSELRMRTGSVWLGFLTHFLIALQIELVALFCHGLL